ncbi:MAG: hypothetical protein JNG90_12530 [Planctomycetaceae bacterium]|nr:hypothetical protein [Planctomycetaceae bacterium]
MSLSELLALPVEWRLGQRILHMAPLTLADLARIEQLLAPRPTSSGEELAALVERWVAQRAGTSYVCWLAARRHQPDLSLAEIERLVATVVYGRQHRRAARSYGEARGARPGTSRAGEALFRRLARRYGWTPRQIAQLTLMQARALAYASRSSTGRIYMQRSELRDWQQSHRGSHRVEAPPAPDRAEGGAQQARLAQLREQLGAVFAPLTASMLRALLEPRKRPRSTRYAPAGAPFASRRRRRAAPTAARELARLARELRQLLDDPPGDRETGLLAFPRGNVAPQVARFH